MAQTTLSQAQRRRLVRFYEEAMEQIAASINKHSLTKRQPRFSAILSETEKALRGLDAQAADWVNREIEKLYRGNVRFIDGFLVSRNVDVKRARDFRKLTGFDRGAIRGLIAQDFGGMGPRMRRINDALRRGVRGYVRDHKAYIRQIRSVRKNIAQAIIMGRGAPETRDAILSDLMNTRPGEFLGLERLSATRPGLKEAFVPLVNAPYVARANGSRMHVFDHVQMIATTMESEVRTIARNNRMLHRGIELVQVTPNPPLTPDACALYAGRVYALTEESARATGYPHIGRLPNGGPPFHPHCTHSTIPFFEELADDDFARSGVRRVPNERGTPRSALDRDFREVQSWMKQRGGFDFAIRQNPQLRRGPTSSLVSDDVRRSLSSRKGARRRRSRRRRGA